MMRILIFSLLLGIPWMALGQSELEELELELKQSQGIKRLRALNQVAELYIEKNSRKGLQYAREASIMADNLFRGSNAQRLAADRHLHADAHLIHGKLLAKRKRYYQAKESFEKGLALAEAMEYARGIEEGVLQLSKIEKLDLKEENILSNTFRKLDLSKEIWNKTENLTTNILLNQARSAEADGNYLKAIKHYEKAIESFANQGKFDSLAKYSQHIAELHIKTGNEKEALLRFEEAKAQKEVVGDSQTIATIQIQVKELEDLFAQPVQVQRDKWEKEKKEEIQLEKERYKSEAESSEINKDYKKSLEYYKLYAELDKISRDKDRQMDSLKKERQIQALTLAQQENQILEDQKNKRNLILGMAFFLIAAVVSFFLYRSKNTALGKLTKAYSDLKRTQILLVSAEENIKNLLDQQVGGGIAKQLLSGTNTDLAQKKFVCVMFLDIRDFTPFAEKKEPEEIIRYQNEVFGFMIDIIDRHKGTINQFLGDGFMATFGLQENGLNPCENAYFAAKEIITHVNEKSDIGIIPDTRVGIGLHAGDVVAGNVGTEIRKQYSITGNTVITAARIEQLNKKFRSQLLISKAVCNGFEKPIELPPEDFMEVEVKGQTQPVELLKIA